MHPRFTAGAVSSEAADFAEELRRVFQDLARAGGGNLLTGECSPALDVLETDDAVEIAVDLPSVAPGAVRVMCKGGAVLIAGEKSPRRGQGDSTFHLVERGYGRFARVVVLTSACDASQARATLLGGELRIVLPKIKDRRGRTHEIAVSSERPVA